MAILGTAIVAALRVTLLDPSPGVTWTDPDFLKALNSALLELCFVRPDAHTVRGNVSLAAGVHQSLPAGGTVAMNMHQNVASGRACTLVDADLLTACQVSYPAATQETDVQDFAIDPRTPQRFMVLPPNNGSGVVLMSYCSDPAAMAALTDPIPIADSFETPLKHFMLGELYAANTTRQDVTKATFYRGEAKSLLGVNKESRDRLVARLISQGAQAT